MAVYNLGTLQQPEAQANPYMEGLMKFGMRAVLNRQDIEGRKEIAKAASLEEAKQNLAQDALKQAGKTKEVLTGTWQALSDKPNDQRQLFLESDKGREYLKTVKKYVPEVFDDNGKPIFFPSTKDQIKQGLDEQISVVRNKLLNQGPDSLTEGEGKILEMEGYKDSAVEVVKSLISNPAFIYEENPEKQQEMIRNGIMMMKSRGGQGANVTDLSNALGGNENVRSLKPTRFKVTPM